MTEHTRTAGQLLALATRTHGRGLPLWAIWDTEDAIFRPFLGTALQEGPALNNQSLGVCERANPWNILICNEESETVNCSVMSDALQPHGL